MIRLLADENLNANLVRGLVRRLPHLDIVRAQDVGLGGADDPTVLAWLLTHDVRTVTRFAWERVARAEAMCGVVEVRMGVGLGSAIEDLVILLECCNPSELEGQILYVPL